MSMSHCILLDHAHIGDRHILSFIDLILLILQDYEHITLHTPPSCPYWRWTYHPFVRRFNLLSTTKWLACHIANFSIMPTFTIDTSFPSSIRFAWYYKIYEQTTFHTPPSCPHWRSTHPFFYRFDSLSTTRWWARHVAYSSIMPTMEINSSLPSSICFA
jgi:hypothetical protein